MNEKTNKPSTETHQTERGGVEGEGSYTATHNYDAGVADSVKKGNTEKLGREAAEALEGPEADVLRQAENAGKSGNSLKQ